MNSRQRVEGFLRRTSIDRVPVQLQNMALTAQAMSCSADYTPGEMPRVVGAAIEEWQEANGLRVPEPEDTFPLTVDQGPFTLTSQITGLERFVQALALHEAEEFRKEGVVFDFPICGYATPIVHHMVAARGGSNGPVRPRLLRFGSKQEVEQACRQVLELWMPQGGLFFETGCTLAQDTPEENIRMLMHCAQSYGSYN